MFKWFETSWGWHLGRDKSEIENLKFYIVFDHKFFADVSVNLEIFENVFNWV